MQPSDDRAALKGVLLAILAWQIVPFMDAIAKYLSASYPVLQIVWARFFFHFIVVAPVVLWRHGPSALVTRRPLLQIARGGFLFGATLLFFSAIRHIPLANAIALVFLAPVLVTALSPYILGERVAWSRWAAVLVGFAAVVIIVRPGLAGFHWATLLALGTAVCFGLYLLSTRMLAGTAPPLVTLGYQSILGLVVTTLALPWIWVTPPPGELLAMASIGVIAAAGHFLVIKSFEYADASLLAPCTYTEIIMATILGYVVFGDLPDAWTWTGIALIVGTAVYLTVAGRR